MTATATLLDLVLADPHCQDRLYLSDLWEESPWLRPDVDLKGAEVVYRDGDAVPWGIRCTMKEWCGGTCNHCDSYNAEMFILYGPMHNKRTNKNCSQCKGVGGFISIAAAVCGAWPIVEIEFKDREPCGQDGDSNFGVGWFVTRPESEPSTLDQDVWVELPKIWVATKTIAKANLSYAALTLGRKLAGLHPLAQQTIGHHHANHTTQTRPRPAAVVA